MGSAVQISSKSHNLPTPQSRGSVTRAQRYCTGKSWSGSPVLADNPSLYSFVYFPSVTPEWGFRPCFTARHSTFPPPRSLRGRGHLQSFELAMVRGRKVRETIRPLSTPDFSKHYIIHNDQSRRFELFNIPFRSPRWLTRAFVVRPETFSA